MRIAYIGWGSLIWNQGSLKLQGTWQKDGPYLPVEFARVSQDGRLTLVLYRDVPPVQTFWAYAEEENLNAAIKGLRLREGTTARRIGYLSLRSGKSRCGVVKDLVFVMENWLRDKGLDAAVWTDLPANFVERTGMDFTTENAISYLKSLEGNALSAARNYIVNAPASINSPLRRAIEEELGWKRS